jgi:hypothetical protein
MEDHGNPLLTIGQLASRTGLPVCTIRYWSDIGAVPPAGRSSSGHRLYAPSPSPGWIWSAPCAN